MSGLENTVAIITGASAGIGKAAAILFAAQGAAVVLNARNAEPLENVAEAIRKRGGRAHCVAGDAALPATHEKLVSSAKDVFGGLDIGFNNAGAVGTFEPIAEQDFENWNKVIAANLTSAFLGARYQIPLMLERGGGALVFTSSFVGTSSGIPGMAIYGAAKAGIMGLVKGITADHAAQGIRANALITGGTDTAMAGNDAQKTWAAGLHAVKRIAQPEEIAKAALFLASPMASFVAGSALYVDGGNAAVK